MDNLRHEGALAAPAELRRTIGGGPAAFVEPGGRVLPMAAAVILLFWWLSMPATRELVGMLLFVVMSAILCPRTRAPRQARAEASHG
ncbi:hypothetical protein ACYX7E_13950 [Luteimonas sp. RIT-PG2_3]